MKKKQLMAVCGILAAALCFGGCGKVDGTQTVLTVNDDQISMGTALFDLRYQQAEMFSYYEQMYQMYGMEMDGYWSTETSASAGETSETSEISETSETEETSSSAEKTTYGEQFKDDVMETLTNMVLMSQHAQEYGVVISEEDEAAIKEAAQKFVDDNDAQILEKNGIDVQNVQEYMRLYTIFARMQEPMVADVDTEVSDEEAKKSTVTYVRIKEAEDTSSEEGSETEEAEEKKFASLKDEAQAVLDRLKQEADIATADIEAIASEVGDDTFTAQVSYDAEDLVYDAKMKEAANTLSDGQLYDGVIEGEDGNYYLVRMDSVLDREKTDENKETILENRKSDAYDALLKQWKDESSVTVNTSLWKKVKVQDSEQYRVKEVPETEETSEVSGASETEEVSEVSEASETESSEAAE